MAERRPAGYPKLKNYKPSRFMLPTSHYDKAKADRAVKFIENLCHTKGEWAGKRFWLLPWQEQLMPCRNPIEPIQIFTANQNVVFYSTNSHEKAQMDNGS